ncbi:transposase, putative [Heliomicrobium modesticaldum Ice1]|uniref:Transposase, putative n=1 Tax=Heliobacterium modesticaldum (strain ATCC 51547 / Ice1) TaxID=498761 RepID=B0THH6_HELMI|nr:transposase [Heliomicrobium modesticaldum]ABZ83414.1 transposase, putative [Heliomicrobium modesticaldum Ice1]ABZ83420.1 transposase, putative [Heliomicrobium modesticaldum Ice1]
MTGQRGHKYSPEFKESIVRRMMPPENATVAELSEETGVTEVTLYKWRREARINGNATPGDGRESEQWSSEDKFLIVMETYAMNENDLSEYCRKKGLYPEQIEAWRKTCLHANARQTAESKELKTELREEKKRSKSLERDLRRKEKALAEAAALLVLQKKVQAIWGEPEDE